MNKNFDDDDYHYMNNKNSASSNPKVIQIPVHHFKSSNSNETNSLPKTSTGGFDHGGLGQHDNTQKHNQDFFNRNPNHQGIFDDFQSPFDLIDHRNRSLFNREQPFGSRFDEFFRPNLTAHSSQPQHHSSADQYLNRAGKSPNRDLPQHNNSRHISPDGYINPTSAHRQSPTVIRTESPHLRTESPSSYRLGNASYQIPVQHREFFPGSDFRLRTESPIRQASPTLSAAPKVAADPAATNSKQPSPPLQTEKQLKQPIVLPEPPQKVPKQQQQVQPNSSDFIKDNTKSEKPTSQPISAKHKHIPKPNPVINLPKVIPLPEPEPHPEKKTTSSGNTQEAKDMGNTFQGQGSKRNAGGTASDFAQAHQSSPQPEAAPVIHPPPAQAPVKTHKEKLDDIAIEIERLQIELTTIKPGCGKKDKQYLKLEELLTRCLLRLDEIEKTDEIKDLRKSLIVASNKLLDQLETIALQSEAESNSDIEPPSSKRPKSPKTEGDSSSSQPESQSNETAATSE